MKVINVSLDPHLLDTESVAAVRARMYGKIIDTFTVVVPTPSPLETELSDTVMVYGSGGINKVVRFWRMFLLIRNLVRSGDYDVISTQDPYFLGLLGLYFARRYHLGFEIHILGLEKRSSVRMSIARFVLKRISSVRVNSKHLYDWLQTEFGVSPDRITYAPIYINIHKAGLGVRTFNAEETRLYDGTSKEFERVYGDCVNFLAVNRLVPVKRLTLQIQAIKHLKETHDNVRLHIVGEGPLRSDLEKEIQNLGLEKHVILHGAKYGPELGVFYIHSDCFVLTSESEGWGMVITEATTAGLPVIMTDVGCAGEFIKNGESGIVLPVYDTLEPLIDAMERIIADAPLRNALVEGAFKELKALPDLSTILSLYKQSWLLAVKHTL